MNIRRRLFRLWAIGGIALIGASIIGFVIKGAKGPEIFLVLTVWVFFLITVLVIGRAAFWIVDRFKEPPTQNQDTAKQRESDGTR